MHKLFIRERLRVQSCRSVDSVICYINKCTADFVPWVNGKVHAKPRTQIVAFNFFNLSAYKNSRYDLQKAIRYAKYTSESEVKLDYHNADLQCLSAFSTDELNTYYIALKQATVFLL